MNIENLSRLISEPSNVVLNVGPAEWDDEEAWHYYPCTFKVVETAGSRSGFHIEWDVPVKEGCVYPGRPYRGAEIFSMVDGKPLEIVGHVSDLADRGALLSLVQSSLDDKAEAVLNHSYGQGQPSLVTLNPIQAQSVIHDIEQKLTDLDAIQITIDDERVDTFECWTYRACRVVVPTGTAEPSGLFSSFKKSQPNGFVINMHIVTKDGVPDSEASDDAYFTLSSLHAGKDSCSFVLPDRSELRKVLFPVLLTQIQGQDAEAQQSAFTSAKPI